MALYKIICGIQHLALDSAVNSSRTTLTCISQGSILERAFHTSPVCARVLNRRLYPINKEPSSNGRWEEMVPMREKYKPTIRPLPRNRFGGKGPNGRMWNWKRAGGVKRHYRMIDLHRCEPDMAKPLVERVQEILYDPNRTARIALVASGERKRYIIATVNMKPGDLITSSRQLFDSPVRAAEGDAYPVGSLAIGTVVNSLELYPGDGALAAKAAGTQAQIIRKTGEHVILRLPSKYEVAVLPTCMATVGRVSNITHNQKVIGKAGRNRWKGIRPKSGYFQKKTGRFGRKIRTQKAVQVYRKPVVKKDRLAKLPFDLLPRSRIEKKQFHY